MQSSFTSPFKVEFITVLTRASAAFEKRIVDAIPPNIKIRDRSGSGIVSPEDRIYKRVLEAFTSDVSDQHSCSILQFLYQFELYFKDNLDLFAMYYKKYFITSNNEERWLSIRYDFPRLSQTAISTIVGLSETTVGLRLDDLERVGLIQRGPLLRSRPRHAAITPQGVEVIEGAIEDGLALLRPLLGVPQETEAQTTPPMSVKQERPPIP